MIKSNLREFIESVVENKRITAVDVRHLQRNVLEDGVASRDEAEALLALDRTLDADESWGEALVSLLVDYVVWGARPTGKVTAQDARWLASVLDVGGPTANAMQIAYAVIEEAQDIDEALLDFVMRGRQQVLAA
jgi:hypothetical protein